MITSGRLKTVQKNGDVNDLYPPGLSRREKQSIFLVLIGTFLEYFDLVLYVHLAVILNPLFFPTSDPWIAGLLGVFTFSSVYILRPLGAFVFGYIGDHFGRKASIIWTSVTMGLTTLTIACLPPYASLGFAASLIFILARALQGFSSIGEWIGALVFTSEVSAKSPRAYFLSILPTVCIILGSTAALGIGLICLHLNPESGWRWAFFTGSIIAFVGGVIRLKAIESPAFQELEKKKKKPTQEETIQLFQTLQFRKKNYWYYFGMEALGPLMFYFSFRYCSDLLKQIGLVPTDIMLHNFSVCCVGLSAAFMWGYLALHYDPLRILKTKWLIGLCCTPFFFATLGLLKTELVIFGVQCLTVTFLTDVSPAQFKIVHAFPVIGRCTNLGSAYAISHAAMYVVTSSFIFFLDHLFGVWGVGALFIGVAALALFCVSRFTSADKIPPLVYDKDKRELSLTSSIYPIKLKIPV